MSVFGWEDFERKRGGKGGRERWRETREMVSGLGGRALPPPAATM